MLLVKSFCEILNTVSLQTRLLQLLKRVPANFGTTLAGPEFVHNVDLPALIIQRSRHINQELKRKWPLFGKLHL